jgi:hypothetical protein
MRHGVSCVMMRPSSRDRELGAFDSHMADKNLGREKIRPEN